MSNPRYTIEKLIDSGMKESEITDWLRQQGIEVTQATINRIKNGRIKKTSFEIGSGLMRLREQRAQQSA